MLASNRKDFGRGLKSRSDNADTTQADGYPP